MLLRPHSVPIPALYRTLLSPDQPWRLRVRCIAAQRQVAGGQPAAETPAEPQSRRQPAEPTLAPSRPPPRRQHIQALVSSKLDAMVGWKVLLQRSGAYVGTVKEVMLRDDSGLASPLLRVVSDRTPDEFGPDAVEEHIVPLVPAIVSESSAATRTLHITPPQGLLQLGRRRMVLNYLRHALLDLELASVGDTGVVRMPTREQLVAAGRQDLVAHIIEAGGFLEAAQQLGFRSRRRPAGYWDNEDNLDREIAQFVAANWTHMEHSQPANSYWYNQVTGRVQWHQPTMPQMVELDDSGDTLFVDPEEDRVMPSRSTLLSAGRFDLHHAIKYQGGYQEVGQSLGRVSAWPRHTELQDPRTLAAELRAFQREQGADECCMPSARALLDADRPELLQAIRKLGGHQNAARVMRFRTARQQKHRWRDFDMVVRELAAFIASQPECCRHRMPTHREILEAGRNDLRYALQLHSHLKLAKALGVAPSSRGGYHKVTNSDRKQAKQETTATGAAAQ